MESAAQRRLRAISGHLIASSDPDKTSNLSINTTVGEFVLAQGYSVVFPEKLQTGKWNVYRSARSPLKLVSRHAVETFRNYKYLGTRIRMDGTVGEYKWMTYGEAGTSRSAVGSGLIYHGIPRGACIGLYFINRPEWIILDHACSAYSYISVPLYDTLGIGTSAGPDAVQYIVNHASVEVIFCVPQTLSTLKPSYIFVLQLLIFLSQMSSVRLIVVVGGIDEKMPSISSATSVKIITYSKLISEVTKEMWDYLQRIYHQDNIARRFQIELEISNFNQGLSKEISEVVNVAYAAQGKNRGKGQMQCYSCKEFGHIARNCDPTTISSTSTIAGTNQPITTPEMVQQMIITAFSTLGLHGQGKIISSPWFVDFGASNHMTGSPDWLHNLQKYTCKQNIQIANGSNLLITAIGDIGLSFWHVFVSPRLSTSLISAGQLVDNNRDVNFFRRGCLVQDGQGR
ncbi:hypothetical protein ZIOFF_053498 [Zingiber officinale]|uniref:CCHC-type domain-containing protein n=1 Tax=Zingiber officinale TaxID=94328 RepID=A0A8J5FG67_ZINOF|nr:hypothetical protein ZIOFF_053498 [Zingiber officinale]